MNLRAVGGDSRAAQHVNAIKVKHGRLTESRYGAVQWTGDIKPAWLTTVQQSKMHTHNSIVFVGEFPFKEVFNWISSRQTENN